MQVVLVGGGERGLAGRVAGGDGDHPVAGRELGVQRRAGGAGHVGAAVEHALRRALGDERRWPRSSSARTETRRRSWSNGSVASRV